MAKECNSKTCDKTSCEGCSNKGKNMDLMAEANACLLYTSLRSDRVRAMLLWKY